MTSLLKSLIKLSEKAANLARLIRSEHALFELLVEEKAEIQKNDQSFVRDFKTLADVLIQEMIRFDISQQYYDLAERVYGEESNKFTNTLGETITVGIQPSQAETAALLCMVLNDNKEAASLLAEALHRDLDCPIDDQVTNLQLGDIDIDSLGIWIDPIDGTSEYIKGISNTIAEGGIYQCGLQCALVLIGAFDVTSGVPVMGVINQPFSKINSDKSWSGRYLWGVSHGSIQVSSLQQDWSSQVLEKREITTILSSSENKKLVSKLATLGSCWTANGAGYKMLCVVEGFVDCYVVSQGSTYKWDSCAPHAILKSLGGGMLSLGQAVEMYHENGENQTGEEEKLKSRDVRSCELLYHMPDSGELSEEKKWSNYKGVIAFSNEQQLPQILKVITSDL